MLAPSPRANAQQSMRIAGNVQDTVAKAPLRHAVALAIRLKDSLMLGFARSNAAGAFELKNLPIDTCQVIISHPSFGERNFFVFGHAAQHEFDFGRIILPSKSVQANEVVIFAYKEPIYYKGDTLVFTADSFKVKKNGTVEDLLRKLPGVQVDGSGKITIQGKQVDQVLVDGDEFFGTDPTVATKNLGATDVESVQVYDKKSEGTASAADEEATKVMNLQLKEEAKKGYFGKVTGASDFQRFHEGEVLANRFTTKRKVSVFGLASNTPRSNFGWQDMFKFGLSDWDALDMEDGGVYFFTQDNRNQGIPQTLKGGVYYADKWSKKTKASVNYSFNAAELEANSSSSSQYFLSDTSYVNNTDQNSLQRNELHSLDLKITQTLDSLTELKISSKNKFGNNSTNRQEQNRYFKGNYATHTTAIDNLSSGENYSTNSYAQLTRFFKKKDRKLALTYSINMGSSESSGILRSRDEYYNGQPNDSIDQQKTTDNINKTHNISFNYTEPVGKKIKWEFTGEYIYGANTQNKRTLDFFNGSYSSENLEYSSDFENVRTTGLFGTKFIYEVKKHKFNAGVKARRVEVESSNFMMGQEYRQELDNLLPTMGYRYKPNDTRSYGIQYKTNSRLPDINQLQPVPDNSNTNQVKLGNPGLLPSFTHTAEADIGNFKPVAGWHHWGRVTANVMQNAITNSITYDTLGRTTTMPVNVNGNYTIGARTGGEVRLFKSWLIVSPYAGVDHSVNRNFINGQENITTTTRYEVSSWFTRQAEKYEVSVSGRYEYNQPSSTVSEAGSEPYSLQEYKLNV